MLGNPLIADATIQSGGLMVITGKGYGKTNIIALDRGGKVLMDGSIEVRGPRADVVVVYKGVQRETYACAPFCEKRITLGDGTDYFDATIGQTATRNGLARRKEAAQWRTVRAPPGTGDPAPLVVATALTARGGCRRLPQQFTNISLLLLNCRGVKSPRIDREFRPCSKSENAIRKTRAAAVARAVRRLARRQDGSAAVEFGLVAAPFLALTFAIMETAIVFFSGQALETAVANLGAPHHDRPGADPGLQPGRIQERGLRARSSGCSTARTASMST